MSAKVTCNISRTGPGGKALRLLASALAARKAYVAAGFLGEGENEGPGITTTDLALIHEFGAPAAGIPARPFVGPAFQKHRAEYMDLLERAVRASIRSGLAGGNPTAKYLQGLGLIGAKMASDIKNFVTQGAPIPPPNAPATLARKQAKGEGEPRTLVDTGRMLAAVTWAVRKE